MNKEIIIQGKFTGERALYDRHNLRIEDSVFMDGESPLKESSDIDLNNCSFKWKYPFWYCKNINVENSSWLDMARAGCWYVENMSVKNCLIEAPKNFRKCTNLTLTDVNIPNAAETLWNCDKVTMKNVSAKGDYFGMGTNNIDIDGFVLDGNYSFDGCKNITIRNAKMLSKDAFWNCDNVTVYDSYICGEYLGWNSSNITLINCTIESLQGMCYIDNLVMKNCKTINTNLAFEYSTVDVEITNKIDSILNPKSGKIKCKAIGELIVEENRVDKSATVIDCYNIEKASPKPEWIE